MTSLPLASDVVTVNYGDKAKAGLRMFERSLRCQLPASVRLNIFSLLVGTAEYSSKDTRQSVTLVQSLCLKVI